MDAKVLTQPLRKLCRALIIQAACDGELDLVRSTLPYVEADLIPKAFGAACRFHHLEIAACLVEESRRLTSVDAQQPDWQQNFSLAILINLCEESTVNRLHSENKFGAATVLDVFKYIFQLAPELFPKHLDFQKIDNLVLIRAVEYGQLDVLRFLIEDMPRVTGRPVDLSDEQSCVLRVAVRVQKSEMLTYLLEEAPKFASAHCDPAVYQHAPIRMCAAYGNLKDTKRLVYALSPPFLETFCTAADVSQLSPAPLEYLAVLFFKIPSAVVGYSTQEELQALVAASAFSRESIALMKLLDTLGIPDTVAAREKYCSSVACQQAALVPGLLTAVSQLDTLLATPQASERSKKY